MISDYGWSQTDIEGFYRRNSDFTSALASSSAIGEKTTRPKVKRIKPVGDQIYALDEEGALINGGNETATLIDDNIIQDVAATTDYGALQQDTAFQEGYNKYQELLGNGITKDELDKLFAGPDGAKYQEWFSALDAWKEVQDDIAETG